MHSMHWLISTQLVTVDTVVADAVRGGRVAREALVQRHERGTLAVRRRAEAARLGALGVGLDDEDRHAAVVAVPDFLARPAKGLLFGLAEAADLWKSNFGRLTPSIESARRRGGSTPST